MPSFAYRALGPEGGVVEGVVRAGDREGAAATLRRRNVAPLSIRPAATSGGLLSRLRGRAAPHAALTAFTRDLETLLAAKVPVGRALEMLAQGGGAPRSEAVAGELLARLRGGASLAGAMEADPDFFPPFYRGMVRAGEESGALPEVLGRIADMLERGAALRAEIRSQLAYPILILVLSGATIALMLAHVIPQFRPVFEQSGGPPPLSTRLVLGASDLANDYGWIAALILAAVALSARPFARSPGGRATLDRLALRTPLLGQLTVKIETARFCRMLGTLVANGVALIDATRIAGGAVGNARLGAATRAATEALARGEPVTAALSRAGWLPDRATQLAAVGAESGRLGDMLLKVADIYEAEAGRTARRLVGLIAPLTTILLGCVIGLMAWSIIGAVLGAYEQAI